MLSAQTDEKIAKMAQSLGLYIYDISMLKENDNNILRVSITRKAPMQKLDSQKQCGKFAGLPKPKRDDFATA